MGWTIADIEKDINDLCSLYAVRGGKEAHTDALTAGCLADNKI